MSRTAPLLLVTLATLLLASCDKSDVKLHHVYLTCRTDKLAPTDTTLFTLHPYPENATVGFPDAPVIFSSSDTTVGSITQSGIFSALKFGTTTITANFGPLTATKLITVSSTANLPDQTLLSFLLDRFDSDHDGILEGHETASTTGLDLTDLSKSAANTTIDMTGLDNFVNIQTLRIERLRMQNLDLSKLHALREVHIDTCSLTTLDLRNCPNLTDIRIMACHNLQNVLLGSMQQYGANNLRTLHISRCDISSLDLSRCGATLWDIAVDGNPRLTSLDLSLDSMIHSIVYSCNITNVAWPTNINLSEVIQVCE